MSELTPRQPAQTVRSASIWSPLVVVCLAATWIVWGTMFLPIKWALVSFPPCYQMGTQFLVAGVILTTFARLRGSAWPAAIEWRGGAVLGVLLVGAGYGFLALAETSVGSGLVVAFTAIVPTMVALAELVYGIRPSRLQSAGITLGLLGIILLTRGQGFEASPAGLLSITASCLSWTIGSVWAVHGMPGGGKLHVAPSFMGAATQMLIGGVALLVISRLIGERPTWPPGTFASLSWAYVLVAGSLISYTAYLILLDRTTPTLATSYTYVNPVVALLLGVTLGQETVAPLEWLAVAVVLCGVVLLTWRPARKP